MKSETTSVACRVRWRNGHSGRRQPAVRQGLRRFRVPRFTRPIGQWLNLLVDTGFLIERVEEPRPTDEAVRACPHIQDAQVVGVVSPCAREKEGWLTAACSRRPRGAMMSRRRLKRHVDMTSVCQLRTRMPTWNVCGCGDADVASDRAETAPIRMMGDPADIRGFGTDQPAIRRSACLALGTRNTPAGQPFVTAVILSRPTDWQESI